MEELVEWAADHHANQFLARGGFDRYVTGVGAIAQHGDAIADVQHLLQAVGDEDDGYAAIAQLADDVEERLHLGFAQCRGRLVHDEHAHVTRDRLGNLDHLLLGNGERAHQRSRPQVHAHAIQDGARLPFQFRPADEERWSRFAPDEDVLHHGEIGHQVQFLVDDGDAQLLGMVGVVDLNRLSAKQDFAAVRHVDAGENFHQRRFAGAVLPDQAQDFARAHMKADILQRLNTWEGLADIFHPQQCAVLVHASMASWLLVPCRHRCAAVEGFMGCTACGRQ